MFTFLWAALAVAAPRVEGQLVIDGVPEIPAAVVERTTQYENVRSAGFVGWHPAGAGLYVSTRFGETNQVHHVAAPGADRRQLTFYNEPVGNATIDPAGDGRNLVIARDVGGREAWQFYRLDLASGRSTLLTDGTSRNELGPWANAGGRFAFSSTRRNKKDFDLYVMDPADPTSTRLVLEVTGQWNVVDWSADDTRLLVKQFISAAHSRLHVLDLASGTLTEVAPSPTPVSWEQATFAADGRSVLATSDASSDFTELVQVQLADGATTRLTADIPWDVEGLSVSRDGKQLAYITNEGGQSVVWLAPARAPHARKRLALPDGVVGGVAFDPAGKRLAVSLTTPRSPTDVWVVDLARPAVPVRWTTSEVGGLDPASFVAPELVKVPSFDGVAVPAWVYRAPREGKRPVVIAIHGGPEAQTRNSFTSTYQYWLRELGVSVIAPNVRGSTGYGRKYLQLDDGQKRMDAVKDIGALLDWIRTQPDLDAERVAVYGGSYGGFMVLASLVAYPERLRCGVDSVGISNFVTFLENTEDYRKDLRRVEYGDERDPAMRTFLQDISPLTHVDRIVDPLFVVQGRNDPRVPMSEAEQIVASLRQRQAPVWYLLANDEGHGFRRKGNRDFLTRAVTLFFEEHLLR